MLSRGLVGSGRRGSVWYGQVRPGEVWRGRFDLVRSALVRLCEARWGLVGQVQCVGDW